MKVMRRLIGCVCALAMVPPSSSAFADDLDFDQREFKATWRQRGTGNKISFSKTKGSFAVEFGGRFIEYNTSDATFSRCDAGRDGGANLCVSGRSFDCAFLVTLSKSNVAYLDLRRSGRGDVFCRGMQGDYVIVVE